MSNTSQVPVTVLTGSLGAEKTTLAESYSYRTAWKKI